MNETTTHSRMEKTVKASEFARILLSMASEIKAEMKNILVTFDGDIITAIVDDATITFAPRQAQEGGAA